MAAKWLRGELYTLVRFVAVGVLNSAFGYVAYALLLLWLPRSSALLVSHVLGVLFNFHSLALGVFDEYRYRLLVRFSVAYTVVYFVNLALLEALCHGAGVSDLLGQALSIPPTALLSFGLLRRFVFVRGAG
jgi:putative flippase GtrA